MKKSTFFVSAALICAGLLAGCGSKTDANEKNFSAAITQYLDKKGKLCLNLATWPVELDELDLRLVKSIPTGRPARIVALEEIGLVKGEDAVSRSGQKVKRFSLTETAKPYVVERTVNRMNYRGNTYKENLTLICWGQAVFDKIIKWEGPKKSGDYQEATVKYLYRLEGVAEWSKNPAIRASFPDVGQFVENAGKKEWTLDVKLTNIGWEAKALDN